MPVGQAYLPSGGVVKANVLSKANVDSVAIGCRLNEIEPTEGKFVFDQSPHQSFKDQLAILHAQNPPKLARLEIDVGVAWRPAWVDAKINADTYAGIKFFQYVDPSPFHTCPVPPCTITIPVFWEPTWIAIQTAAAQAMAAYIGNDPLITVVTVPLAPGYHNDYNLGSTSSAVDGLTDIYGGNNPQQRWVNALKKSPYDGQSFEAAMIDINKKQYAMFRAAFGNRYLTSSVGNIPKGPLAPNGGDYFSLTVMKWAYDQNHAVAVTKWNANAVFPPSPGTGSAWATVATLHAYGLKVFVQAVWKAYNNNPTTTGTCVGDKTKVAYRMNGNVSDCANDAGATYEKSSDIALTYDSLNYEGYEEDLTGQPQSVLDYVHNSIIAHAKAGVSKAKVKSVKRKRHK
jgi:hypothetical protein